MSSVVWVRVIGVHVLDRVENANGVEGVVVLVDMIFYHHIKKVPSNVIVRCNTLISV